MATNPTGRRLRISSKPNSAVSWDVNIQDAETGEYLSGINRIVITLDANSNLNEAEVTYYELGDKGGVMIDGNGDPIKHTVKVQNVEIDDLTCFEIMDNIRKERS